jgi:UDP-N-acetylmuramoyl-tripeptide--D-alanyl-D-alanine ligase
VLATEGNLNNDIGMPLTLLKLRPTHRYAVIEMGMNHAARSTTSRGSPRRRGARQQRAARAHRTLGSVEAIARAKGEIYAGLGRRDRDRECRRSFASTGRGSTRGGAS